MGGQSWWEYKCIVAERSSVILLEKSVNRDLLDLHPFIPVAVLELHAYQRPEQRVEMMVKK